MRKLLDSSNKNQYQHSVCMSSIDNIIDQAQFIDNGTSSHVRNDVHNMQHRQKYHGKESFTIGDDEKLNICHIALVKLPFNKENYLLLKETFHVSEIKKNFIIILKLITSNNIDVEFNVLGCSVKDKALGKVLLPGKQKIGLY